MQFLIKDMKEMVYFNSNSAEAYLRLTLDNLFILSSEAKYEDLNNFPML